MTAKLDELKATITELNHQGRFREAVPLMVEAVELTRIECGDNAPEYIAILNELGGLYRMLGEYDNSESVFVKAKNIQFESEGKENPDYATTINNLAGTYRLKRDYPRSESLFLEAIEIYRSTLGTQHFLYTSALNNLGLLYTDMKKYEKAEQLYHEALEILRNSKKHDTAIATTLNNLATICMEKGNNKDAEQFLKEAIEVYERTVGKEAPLYVYGLNSLAAHILVWLNMLRRNNSFYRLRGLLRNFTVKTIHIMPRRRIISDLLMRK